MLEIKPTRLNGHGLSRSNSSLRLRPRREPTKVLDPHANAGNHATVIHPMDAARNHGFSGAHRVPGAGSHNRLPCLDPDGWLVRTLQTNSNENPAAELNTRAVNSLSSKIGELPLPRAELYPLTRSLLMGGTYSETPYPAGGISTLESFVDTSGTSLPRSRKKRSGSITSRSAAGL